MLSLAQSPVRTLIACFSRRAKEPQAISPHTECPTSGISETLPAKDESSNSGVSKHRDAALYNKSTLFPSRGEGISTLFFNYRFHNGKVDRYLSSFSGSVLTQAATLSTLSRGCLSGQPRWLSLPVHAPLPRPCGRSISSHPWGPRSRLRGRGRAMSDLTTFSRIPETTIKKNQVLKEATFFLTISYASGHVTLSSIYAGDKRN